MKNKLAITFSGLAMSVALPAAAIAQDTLQSGVSIEDANLSPQIRFVVEQQERDPNQTIYVIVDKVEREILVIEDEVITHREPVLIGRERGDSLPVQRGRYGTTAGRFIPIVWTDAEAYRNYHLNTQILYDCNEAFTRCKTLHGVWTQISSEEREERLNSETSDDNAISNGCINLSYSLNGELIAIFQQKRNPDGSNPMLIVPPEMNTSLEHTAEFLGYSIP